MSADVSEAFGSAIVLSKYPVQCFRCGTCRFIQTETPHWLEEAYSEALGSLDTGVMWRNIHNAGVTERRRLRRRVHSKLKRQTAALLHGHCTVNVVDPETWVNTESTMTFIVAVISAEAWPVPPVTV